MIRLFAHIRRSRRRDEQWRSTTPGSGEFGRRRGTQGRKRFIAAFEPRLSHEATHPLFGYRVGYRQLPEIQARVVGRRLLGKIPKHPHWPGEVGGRAALHRDVRHLELPPLAACIQADARLRRLASAAGVLVPDHLQAAHRPDGRAQGSISITLKSMFCYSIPAGPIELSRVRLALASRSPRWAASRSSSECRRRLASAPVTLEPQVAPAPLNDLRYNAH